MLPNDDLALDHTKVMTKIIEVVSFDKFGKPKQGFFERIIRHLFGLPVDMEYLYDCILRVRDNIILANDTIVINETQYHVNNVENKNIWCVSMEWTDKSFTKEDFLNKYLVVNSRQVK